MKKTIKSKVRKAKPAQKPAPKAEGLPKIPPEELSERTGLPISKLHRLSVLGFYPPPKVGGYDQVATIQGLFRYFKQQEEKAGALPIYGSLSHCVGATGVPLAVLRAAKKVGCKAFIAGGQVDFGIFIRWAFREKNPEAAVDWTANKNQWDATLKKAKAQKLAGLLVEVSEVKRQARNATHFYFGELERAERELPPILKGRSELEIFEELKKFYELVRRGSMEHFEKVGSVEK